MDWSAARGLTCSGAWMMWVSISAALERRGCVVVGGKRFHLVLHVPLDGLGLMARIGRAGGAADQQVARVLDHEVQVADVGAAERYRRPVADVIFQQVIPGGAFRRCDRVA